MLIDTHTHHLRPSHLCVLNYDLGDYGQGTLEQEGHYFSVGYHPWNLTSASQGKRQAFSKIWEQLTKFLEKENCLFLGEVGLDKAHPQSYPEQMQFLAELLEKYHQLSEQKPIVFHCVRAYQDIIALLKKYPLDCPVLFHDYNGNQQITEALLKYNAYFSLGRGIFRSNSKLVQDLATIPAQRVLFETDDAEDFTIQEVYKQYCHLTGEDLTGLIKTVQENFILCLGHQVMPLPKGTLA